MRDNKPKTRLKKIRNEKHFTLQKVADEVGITKPYYWQIENGTRGLSYELAVKISSVFDMTPDEIFLPEELTKSEQTQAI